MQALECSPEQAAALLRPVMEGKANPNGQFKLHEILAGRCFRVFDGQKIIGAYVLQGHGAEVWIEAAAGNAEVDLCDLFQDLITKHGAGFETIAFRTDRRGLVKKALKRGFEIVSTANGYTMRKNIQ